MQTILYAPETSEKQPTKPIEILHAILLLSANGQNAINKIIINPMITIAILTFFIACEGELSFPLLPAARQTMPSAGVHASETCSPKGAHTTSGGISRIL